MGKETTDGEVGLETGERIRRRGMYAVADVQPAHASKLGEFEDHGVVPEFRDVHGRVAREARIAELVSAVQLVAAIAEAGDANWAVVRLGKWLA